MAVTAALVKELRERTGLGMMECKKALVETNGDIEVAIENLRKSGQAKAAKKAGRVAAEGKVAFANTGDKAIMLEINCETDFVARDDNFEAFSAKVAAAALEAGVTDVAQIAELEIDGGTVESVRQGLIQKIGENIQIRRAEIVENVEGVIGEYAHGLKIGVLVALKGGDEALSKDVAMHVAATNPMVAHSDDIPAEILEKEKDIFVAQAQESGKPAEIIEKMIQGRLGKFKKEVSLVDQPFVKNPDITVAKLIKDAGAELIGFTRFEVGEGIEKEETDFAAEVAAAAKV